MQLYIEHDDNLVSEVLKEQEKTLTEDFNDFSSQRKIINNIASVVQKYQIRDVGVQAGTDQVDIHDYKEE